MEMGDKAVGLVLTMTSLSIFTYYTFWVIILVSYFWAIHVSFLSYFGTQGVCFCVTVLMVILFLFFHIAIC